MEIKEILVRNYYATKRRGQITDKMKTLDFVLKIEEEFNELLSSTDNNSNDFDIKELADIVLVCFAMAKHNDKDLLKVMEEKMLFNEKRPD
ncbi:MAG: hypothetical protein GZ091_16315 [Paludibacter sp.]|nr:hypothetical protein [Paludibacter sp.]